MTSPQSDTLLQAIQKRVLLGDGAMGTQLQEAGLASGECGEAWNLDQPEKVLAIQRRYVEAGSDCLTTNTFCGSRTSLERHGLGDQATAVNQAAARIAREAFNGRPGFVLGDLGPFGGLMEPFGDVPADTVRGAFAEQAEALVGEGVDAVIVETQTDLAELALGVEAAKSAGAPCVIGSMAYDVRGDACRTMMGVDPVKAARFMADAGTDLVALNCGTGVDADWAARVVQQYRETCDLPTMAQPNAGKPEFDGGHALYRQTPEETAAEASKLLAAGVRILGACCGSTPEHIRALRAVVDAFNAVA